MSTQRSKATQNTMPTSSLTNSGKKQQRNGVVSIIILLVVLIGSAMLYQILTDSRSKKIGENERQQENAAERLGVIIRQSSGAELPIKQEIDQEKYKKAILTAWEEAQQKSPSNVVKFGSDPNLLAFFYTSPNSTVSGSIVVYKNRGVVIDALPASSLPNNVTQQIDLSSDKYQLVVKYQYTPATTELDVASVLTEAFGLAMAGSQDAIQDKNLAPVVAFDALAR